MPLLLLLEDLHPIRAHIVPRIQALVTAAIEIGDGGAAGGE